MNRIRPKRARLRLDPRLYEELHHQVLRRNGWRCQSCGVMSSLEVHHKQFRSRSGDDSEENLITLCTACHASIHRGRRIGYVVCAVSRCFPEPQRRKGLVRWS